MFFSVDIDGLHWRRPFAVCWGAVQAELLVVPLITWGQRVHFILSLCRLFLNSWRSGGRRKNVATSPAAKPQWKRMKAV